METKEEKEFWEMGTCKIVRYDKNNQVEAKFIGCGFYKLKAHINNEGLPRETFSIYDSSSKFEKFVGTFCIEKDEDDVRIGIMLSLGTCIGEKIILDYNELIYCYKYLSKYIPIIRDFLLEHFPYKKEQYRIDFEYAALPNKFDGELGMLNVINESEVMYVFSKYGIMCFTYKFK